MSPMPVTHGMPVTHREVRGTTLAAHPLPVSPRMSAALRAESEACPARRLTAAAQATWYARHGKALFDRVLAAAALVLTLPLLSAAALWVAAVSPGPLLLGQWRIGRGGRPFRMWKLRTMDRDAEAGGCARFAAPSDPRVVRGGHLLRAWHLDELPQLWNVVRGEMALVGPRPERPLFVAFFGRAIPGYTHRHAARPGLTGWAQLRLGYCRSLTGARRKTRLDLAYLARLSWRGDLAVLMRTPWCVARRALGRGEES